MSQRLIRHVTPGVTRLIGQSREVENVRQFVQRISHKDAPVLITGQTGTGKDVVARAIHEESSRTAYPFMAINYASLGENLLSSELFGHERGAFTGASERNQGLSRAAGKGTPWLVPGDHPGGSLEIVATADGLTPACAEVAVK